MITFEAKTLLFENTSWFHDNQNQTNQTQIRILSGIKLPFPYFRYGGNFYLESCTIIIHLISLKPVITIEETTINV